MAYVYQHSTKDTDTVFYIGIGKDLTFRRAKRPDGRSKFWKSIVKKHGGYSVSILYNNISWEQACEYERALILLHGRRDLGTGTLCNLTDGGEGLLNPSPESRKKKSDKTRLNWTKSEYRDKVVSSMKGRKFSESHLQSLKVASIGKKFPKQFSELAYKKLSKKVICLDTGKIYESVKACSREIKVDDGNLTKHLKGNRYYKTIKGLKFSYYEEANGSKSGH
jgi:hypothetical protein